MLKRQLTLGSKIGERRYRKSLLQQGRRIHFAPGCWGLLAETQLVSSGQDTSFAHTGLGRHCFGKPGNRSFNPSHGALTKWGLPS